MVVDKYEKKELKTFRVREYRTVIELVYIKAYSQEEAEDMVDNAEISDCSRVEIDSYIDHYDSWEMIR